MSKQRDTGPSSRHGGFWHRALMLYVDGFRQMTLGKTLWAIIFVKLIVFFVIVKLLFFPDFLKSKSSSDEGKAQYVRSQMTKKQHTGVAARPHSDTAASDDNKTK